MLLFFISLLIILSVFGIYWSTCPKRHANILATIHPEIKNYIIEVNYARDKAIAEELMQKVLEYKVEADKRLKDNSIIQFMCISTALTTLENLMSMHTPERIVEYTGTNPDLLYGELADKYDYSLILLAKSTPKLIEHSPKWLLPFLKTNINLSTINQIVR